MTCHRIKIAFRAALMGSVYAFALAAPVAAQSRNSGAPNGDPSGQAPEVEELLVTAQKRTERMVDVPMSMAVVSGAALTDTQATTLQDLQNRMPGLRVNGNPASSEVVIRGISTGAAGNASTATYVDETPYGSVGPFTGSTTFGLNLDPYDIARVEVLRGPQGTNYGANALAGIVKFVTNAPDPSRFAASILAGASTLGDGGTGYEVHGMVNVPFSDNMALRIVGHDTLFPGYVDVPSRNARDVNDVTRYGARASLLWNAGDNLSIRLNGEYQQVKLNDDPAFTFGATAPGFGSRTRDPSPFAAPVKIEGQIYSGIVKWDLDFASVISTSSYTTTRRDLTSDSTSSRGALLSSTYGGSYGAEVETIYTPHGFTQEVRIAAPSQSSIQWAVGGYYSDANTLEDQGTIPFNLTTKTFQPTIQPSPGAYLITSTYRETAGFANASYDLTDRLTVGAGGRYSNNSQSYHQRNAGFITGTNDFMTFSSESVFTYSTDIKYRLDQHNNVYARVASGFVPGGPNDILPGVNIPATFNSSTTTNYEAGVKGSFTGGFSYDLSVYEIDWNDLQTTVQFGNLFGIGNVGTARSKGLEASMSFSPLAGLDINLAGSYNDAKLTSPAPTVGGQAGDRLPNAPYFTSAVGMRYEQELWSGVNGFTGFDWAYSGNRLGTFSTATRTRLKAYTTLDMRAGLSVDRYRFTIYAKNVFDQSVLTALTSQTYGGVSQLRAQIAIPRTIGLTISATY